MVRNTPQMSKENACMKAIIDQLVEYDLLQHIVEGVPTRVFWKDKNLTYLGCNQLFAEDAGFTSPDDIIGKTDFEMGWKAQSRIYQADDQAVITSGKSKINIEEPQTTPSGATIHLRTSKVPLRDAQGNITGILGIYEDITLRKNNAQSLALSQYVLNHATDAIVWVDENGRFQYCNQSMCDMLGYSEKELLQMAVFDVDKEVTPEGWKNHWRKLQLARQMQINAQQIHKDGHAIPIELSVNFVEFGQVAYNVAFIRDISARKQAEAKLEASQAALYASESKLRNIFDNLQDVYYRVDAQGNLADVSPSVENLFGIKSEVIIGMPIVNFYAQPNARELLLASLASNEGAVTDYEIELRYGDMGSVWVSTNSHFIYSEQGNILGIEGMFRDITSRKKSERELQHTLNFSRQLMEHAAEGMVLWHLSGQANFAEFTVWNRRMTEITGYSIDEINSSGWLNVMYKDEKERQLAKTSMMSVLQGQINRGKDFHIVNKSGQARTLHISSSPMNGPNNEPSVLAMIEDVTEQRQLEEQLRQSQKMEAIGKLVGGIAHDFNNILAAIQGSIFVAHNNINNPASVTARLDDIQSLSSRAADMVQQLLTYARKGTVRMKPFVLNDFIAHSLALSKTVVPENIHFHSSICDTPLPILGDATQVQQILMNLLNNAVDALDGVRQPQIAFEIQSYHASNAFHLRHPQLTQNQFARITIRDNGAGMDDAMLHSIFEPFFTTKEVGKGTGLGLAMIDGSMQTHHGCIEVESVVGQGTSFQLYFPLIEMSKVEGSGIEKQETIQGGGELVLLVDDEEMLRESTCEVLQLLGYEVLTAEDGQEAKALFDQHSNSICLILSDVVMPNMGGDELLKYVRQTAPTLPVILASGYDSQSFQEQSIIDDLYCDMINKPFRFDALSKAIAKRLKP